MNEINPFFDMMKVQWQVHPNVQKVRIICEASKVDPNYHCILYMQCTDVVAEKSREHELKQPKWGAIY